MLNVLRNNRKELEKDIREKVRQFFEKNDAKADNVSIEMQLRRPGSQDDVSQIYVLVNHQP